MEFFTPDALTELLTQRSGPCVSLVVTTEHGPVGAKRARAAWKSLLPDIRDTVRSQLRPGATDDLLAPAEALLVDEPFWHETDGGLALFLAPGDQYLYRLPVAVGDLGVVGDEFALAPLVRFLEPDQPYYVLSLSKNHVALHRGDRTSFEKVKVPDLPESLDDALWYEKHDNPLDVHSGMRYGNAGRPTGTIHGGSSPSDQRRAQLPRFLAKVDKAVVAALNGKHLPLVLAAVVREVSEYRTVSHYDRLAPTAVVGNPDRLGDRELHRRSWKVIEDMQEPLRQRALQRAASLLGTGRTTDDLAEAEHAAAAGLVETLFVSAGAVKDPASTAFGALNRVVSAALRAGAELRTVTAEDNCTATPLLAVLRTAAVAYDSV